MTPGAWGKQRHCGVRFRSDPHLRPFGGKADLEWPGRWAASSKPSAPHRPDAGPRRAHDDARSQLHVADSIKSTKETGADMA